VGANPARKTAPVIREYAAHPGRLRPANQRASTKHAATRHPKAAAEAARCPIPCHDRRAGAACGAPAGKPFIGSAISAPAATSVGSGGGGLIGWTPLPAGFVTGDPAADLQTQLEAILTFNQQWAQYIPALNAATSPGAAADIYVTDFERAGIPAAANREAAAEAVAAACGL
jgi:hypothetical protein